MKYRLTKAIARAKAKAKTNAKAEFEAETEIEPQSLLGSFVPQYNELSLFLMSISFVLLLILFPSLRSDLFVFASRKVDFRLLVGISLFSGGLLLSIIHVFTDRKKSKFEKGAMLYFAMLINVASGLTAGIHELEDTQGILIVFPICNILSALLLLIMYKFDFIKENSIVDDNASPTEVFFGTMNVVMVLVTCRYAFNMYWAFAFSISVTYVTNINIHIQKFINSGPRHTKKQQF